MNGEHGKIMEKLTEVATDVKWLKDTHIKGCTPHTNLETEFKDHKDNHNRNFVFFGLLMTGLFTVGSVVLGSVL